MSERPEPPEEKQINPLEEMIHDVLRAYFSPGTIQEHDFSATTASVWRQMQDILPSEAYDGIFIYQALKKAGYVLHSVGDDGLEMEWLFKHKTAVLS